MKKNKLKSQAGITLTTLMITIVVLSILVAIVVRHVDTGTDLRNYNYMKADIDLLYSKIMTYYNENNSIPTTGDAFNAKTTLGGQASSRDNDNYYQIDLSQLYNITLNFGGGTLQNGDIYIVNEQSHEVYYFKGVVVDNEKYYQPVKPTGSSGNTTGGNTTGDNTTGGNTTDGNTTGGNTTGGETTCTHTSTTATDNGDGTHTITCTNCGVKLITNENHKYVNGKCTVCQSALVIGAKIDYREYIDTDGNAFSTMPSYTSTKATRGSTKDEDSDATYSVSEYGKTIEWIVLGQEGNQIKITTKNIVEPTSGGYSNSVYKYLMLNGMNGYTNSVDELNKIGAVYGHGKYADTTKFNSSGGRSFKMEDFGYGALTKTASYKYVRHSDGKIYRYDVGATVDGTSTTGGTSSKFWYMAFDASNSNQETETSHEWNELTADNSIVTMYDCTYSGSRTLDDSISRASTEYWLASRCFTYGNGYVRYGVYGVYVGGGINSNNYLSGSLGSGYEEYLAVRPVVYLQTGIKLSYDATNGYTISQ